MVMANPRPERAVPCGSCRACCSHELVIIHPENGDDGRYLTRTVPHPFEDGRTVQALMHKPDGSCVYLGEQGCTIYDRRPVVCREFDCRRMVLRLKKALGRKRARDLIEKSETLQAGNRLLKGGTA